MSQEDLRETVKAHRESLTKYTYFLLAAVGAAIGLALTQTRTSPLAWSQVPLGLAVLLWGVSFALGCTHLAYVNSTLYGNVALLQLELGTHPETPAHPVLRDAAIAGVREALAFNVKMAGRYARWQFRFLIAGALFYVAWHLMEMYLRTPQLAGAAN